MSIADKLTYLNDTKSLLREAINAAGGNLTQETPFREYAGGWLRDQSASLLLDFSKQQYVAKDKSSMFPDRVGFEDIVTFARSTGGGRFNAQGQYEWLPADTPRIDYDPVTGECLGLLVEEQRTNLLKRSKPDIGNGSWFPNTLKEGTSVTRIGDVVGVDGELSGVRYLLKKPEAGSGHALVGGNLALEFGTVYTGSVYMKSGNGLPQTVIFYTESSGQQVNKLITLDNEWRRFNNPHFRTTSGAFYRWIGLTSVTDTFNNTADICICAGQVEEGSFPTSYIPTEGAQVTRAADVASVDELSPWFNSSQGSFSIKAKGCIGEPLLTAGDTSIIADSDEMKEYQASYSEDQQATQVSIGKGLIESIRYWPRETS